MTSSARNLTTSALTSTKAEVRKKALADVKKLDAAEAVPLLIGALGTKNLDVQADLVKALLGFKDAALPHLVSALTHPTWVIRRQASTIIARMGDRMLARFLDLIPKNEEDVDYWMVRTLSLMGGEAVTTLVRCFDHASPKISLAAVRAAGNVREPAIVETLLPLLEHPEWAMRKAAFDSLCSTVDLNPAALAAALPKASDEARFWIVKLMGQRHDPKLVGPLLAVLAKDSTEIRLEAIRALAQIDAPEARRALIDALRAPAWILRKAAADALWEQGSGAAAELRQASKADDEHTRYWSVKLLGQTETRAAFPTILERLQDAEPSVRAAACAALGKLGDRRALAPLMTALNDPAEDVRSAAVIALGQIGEERESARTAPKPMGIPAHLQPENLEPCPHCHKKVFNQFAFCPFCLGKLKESCGTCGRTLSVQWKGCPDCGAALASPANKTGKHGKN